MSAAEIALVGSVIVSAAGAIFGLYQARKADRSANTTKTIEIGVKDLIDQYQEANKDQKVEITELKEETHRCTERCKAMESEIRALKRKVEDYKTVIDNKDAEIIRLMRRLGETFE